MLKPFISSILLSLLLIIAVSQYTHGQDLIMNGTVRETFDDNINASVENREWDFITEVIVGLGMRQEGKVQTFDIVGNVTQRLYTRKFEPKRIPKQNAQNVAMNYVLTPTDGVSLHLTDSFQNYPESESFAGVFGNILGRTSYISNNASFTGTFEVTKHYSLVLGYLNNWTKYTYTQPPGYGPLQIYTDNIFKPNLTGIDPRILPDLLNRMTSPFGEDFTDIINQLYIEDYANRHVFNPRLSSTFMQRARMQHEIHWDSSNVTFVYYDYLWRDYKPGTVAQTHTPGLGYRYHFSEQTHAELRLANDFIIPAENVRTKVSDYRAIQDQTWWYSHTNAERNILQFRPYASLALVNNIDKQTNANLMFSYQYSLGEYSSEVFTNWRISSDVSRFIMSRLLMTGSIFYGHGVYTARNNTVDMFGLALGLMYELTEHVALNVGYNFTLNLSKIDGRHIIDPYVWTSKTNSLVEAKTHYLRNRGYIGVRASY